MDDAAWSAIANRTHPEIVRAVHDSYLAEGADIIMIKPALSYLDVINRARRAYNHPIAAYNVSGEFSMVKAGIAAGLVDAQTITLEILTSIKRAGADIIISYHAKEAARWLTEG